MLWMVLRPTTLMGIQLLPLLPKLYILYLLVMHGLNGVVAQLNGSKLKRSTLKSDALHALIMVSVNCPKCWTPEASYLIKQTSISFGKDKKLTQTDKRLDAIILSDKYIVSNLMEMIDSSGTD